MFFINNGEVKTKHLFRPNIFKIMKITTVSIQSKLQIKTNGKQNEDSF